MRDAGPEKRDISGGAAALLESARGWMDDALEAWADSDHAKVTAKAPLALEFLGKAYLRPTNPVLSVQLDKRCEESLVLLATQPDLNARDLRTVGLTDVMERLSRVIQAQVPILRNFCATRTIHPRPASLDD